MTLAPEKPRAATLLLSLPIEGVSVPIFVIGALLVALGGFPIARMFFVGAGIGALVTWITLRQLL